MIFLFISLIFSAPSLSPPVNNYSQQSRNNVRFPNNNTSFNNNPEARNTFLSKHGMEDVRLNNTDFANSINWNNPIFAKFIKDNHEAAGLVNQILTSYNIVSNDVVTGAVMLNLPDPEILQKQVENVLELSESFKNYGKRILHNLEELISTNALILTELVMKLEGKKNEIEGLLGDLNKTSNSTAIFNIAMMTTNQLRSVGREATELIKKFNKNKVWREKMIAFLTNAY